MLNAKETWLFGRLYKVTKYVIYFTYKSAKVQKCSYHQNISIVVRSAVINSAYVLLIIKKLDFPYVPQFTALTSKKLLAISPEKTTFTNEEGGSRLLLHPVEKENPFLFPGEREKTNSFFFFARPQQRKKAIFESPGKKLWK